MGEVCTNDMCCTQTIKDSAVEGPPPLVGGDKAGDVLGVTVSGADHALVIEVQRDGAPNMALAKLTNVDF